MLNEVINWNTAMIVIVSVLSIYAGIKLINKSFDSSTKKKKNSLF